MITPSLRARAREILVIADPLVKCAAARGLASDARPAGAAAVFDAACDEPGRPERPALVPPQQVPRRSFATREGRAALVHALAHIELNAVNLALDIVWRFPGLPDAFYRDWAGVAVEEASHFLLLREHLCTLGFDYGDFAAHNGLWDMARKTADDVLARLALVARTLEARGLDVSPPLRDKLARAGDARGAEILAIILRDEIGHVAIGSRWYHALCKQRGLDPVTATRELAARYGAPKPRGPFNVEARKAAGFSEDELAALAESATMAASGNDAVGHDEKV